MGGKVIYQWGGGEGGNSVVSKGVEKCRKSIKTMCSFE